VTADEMRPGNGRQCMLARIESRRLALGSQLPCARSIRDWSIHIWQQKPAHMVIEPVYLQTRVPALKDGESVQKPRVTQDHRSRGKRLLFCIRASNSRRLFVIQLVDLHFPSSSSELRNSSSSSNPKNTGALPFPLLSFVSSEDGVDSFELASPPSSESERF
jgi:hypothetical protein